MKNFRIFLDMDGVLVDFLGGALRLWGITRIEFDARQVAGVWDITEALEVSHTEFWGRIGDEGIAFWEDLEPLPWWKELVAVADDLADEWFLASSPSWCPTSHAGKVRWIQSRFGERFDRFSLCPHKYLLAQEGAVLVDDSEKNCGRFMFDKEGRPTGGEAIVFPSPHNGRYTEGEDPLTPVICELKELHDAFVLSQRQ